MDSRENFSDSDDYSLEAFLLQCGQWSGPGNQHPTEANASQTKGDNAPQKKRRGKGDSGRNNQEKLQKERSGFFRKLFH